MGRTGRNLRLIMAVAADILIAAKVFRGYAPLAPSLRPRKLWTRLPSGVFLTVYLQRPSSIPAAGRAVLHHLQRRKLVQAATSADRETSSRPAGALALPRCAT